MPPQSNGLFDSFSRCFVYFSADSAWSFYIIHGIAILSFVNANGSEFSTYLVPGVWRKEFTVPHYSINIFYILYLYALELIFVMG